MNNLNDVAQLVAKFKNENHIFTDPSFKEMQLRTQFLDPFFEALGWDVRGVGSLSEVVVEDPITIDGKKKSIDYSFKIGDKRKFLVEAKKPSVALKTDDTAAFQLRRYAWNASLPLGILTDFEEFSIYDCRIKPELSDHANVARLSYYRFEQYEDKWSEIYNLFSREAVVEGKLDAYIEANQSKKGYQTVDTAFLKDIERWREALAKDIAARNPHLNQSDLNFAVQATLDRLIFLRICEDREIEPYERLYRLSEEKNIYQRLTDYFQEADDRYNSGLFHFKKDERPDGERDGYTLGMKIGDDTLRPIIQNLYWPNIYAFSIIPVEILGQVYEQFLGKVITLDSAHIAKVEEKPEVRKAGGVYYTPAYIVDYIVKNTVGKLLEGKTPEEAAALKLVDPACGSGSFLLGAYRYLLEWYLEQYQKFPKKYGKKFAPGRTDRLSNIEKKQILLNNIYGVDIDPQAVEVTKLSLMLKALEGETSDGIKQLRMLRERALPDLSHNIKCGNSLIGMDFLEQHKDLSRDEFRHINPFDWQAAFPAVFKQGGFDAVIGNPPYVRQESLGEYKSYFQQNYKVYHGTADLYTYFFERGVSLLRPQGFFSIIVANKWMRANYGEPLRIWLKQQHINEILDFGDLQVFHKATTYICIICLQNEAKNPVIKVTEVKTLGFPSLEEYVNKNQYEYRQDSLEDKGWSLGNSQRQKLLAKMQIGMPFGKYVHGIIYRGVLTGLDKAFVITKEIKEQIINQQPSSTELIKPYLAGRDVKRYKQPASDRYLILIPYGWTRKHLDKDVDAWEWLEKNYPFIAAHLKPFSEEAQKRYDKGEYWWELRPCDYYSEFEKPKIHYLKFQVKPAFTYDNEGFYCNSAVFVIPKNDLYLLGILNSKLGWFLISSYCTQIQNGYQLIFKYMQQLPIRTINFDDPADKARHDKMVGLVERMLDLHKQLATSYSPHDKTFLQNQISQTDRQIDALVYELYDLSAEEIKIVEGQ